MPGAEEFTILAVLEARDRATAIVERLGGSLNQFSESATRAAEAAASAGVTIDESLLTTASGTDAMVLATSRLEGARTKLKIVTDSVANAEREFVTAQQEAAAAGNSDAAANGRLVTALDELNAAQRNLAKATAEASAAETRQAAVADATAASNATAATSAATAATAQGTLGTAAATSGGLLGKASKGATLAAAAAAALAVISVKAAGDFQSSTQHLVTDAGEAQKNLGMVQSGILKIAVATGTTATALSNSMYHIESSGYHGAAGLNILKTAAEGAKVGGADFDTVGKTLTGTMNSYGMAGNQAVSMMNQLIATTGAGDMRMQDLAASLGNVAPLAAAAGVSFAQVGGAMATMTAQNMTAQQASQDLANTIRNLSNPNQVAIKEMQNLGLNSNDLSKNLGKRGLTGTLETLTQAVAAHTKGGQVLISTFNNSKQAAANADTMIKAMPPNLQKLAQSYLNGTTSLGDWRKELKTLPPIQASMMTQFGTLANKTHSFNDMLKSGSPAAQTYNAAMAKLLGGATGLNTSLMITGGRMATFKDATDKISEAAKKGGSHVQDWDKIQGTFNQKMDVLKASVGAAGIEIGTILLPAANAIISALAGILGPMADWIGQNQTLAGLIMSVVGGLLIGVTVIKTMEMVTKAWAAAQVMLDAAMDANPIGLLIIGLFALAAGLIYAWTHFSGFRAVVIAVFDAVKTAAVAFWHALEIAFKAIVTASESAWHGMVAAWNAVVTAAKAVWSSIVGVWNAVSSATSTAWNAIKDFFAKWWPLLLVIFLPPIALLLAIWNHFHSQITSVATATWNAIADFFKAIWHGIESAASATWDGIKTAVLTPVKLVWSGLQAVWNLVHPYLSSIWNAIKGTASSLWNSIKSAIITPLTSAWHSITTTMSNIASTIKSKITSALNSAKTEAGKFLAVGKAIVDGIVHGIENGAGAIAGAAKHAAGSALSAAKNFLGISSPSKKFKELGGWVVHGLVDGLTGSTASVKSATTRLAKDLYVDFGSAHKTLQKGIAKDNSELLTLANKRDSIATKIKAANKNLTTLQADWTKEQSSVATSIMQNASIVMQPAQYQTLTSTDVLKNLQQQADAAKDFAKQLDNLRAKGLSASLIQQIAAAGVDQGGATAQALASASKAQIAQINKTQQSMQTAANSTGAAVADSMYKSGIDSAKGLIKGLQSQESAIDKQMLKIAKSMQKAIKQALGIHSPSTVFADEVGQHIPTGIAQGIANNAQAANKAVANLAGSMLTSANQTKQIIPTLLGNASKSTVGIPYLSQSSQVGSGQTIVIDLRGSQVMSDRDMDSLVNKIGNRLALRTLPAGGTKIRIK